MEMLSKNGTVATYIKHFFAAKVGDWQKLIEIVHERKGMDTRQLCLVIFSLLT